MKQALTISITYGLAVSVKYIIVSVVEVFEKYYYGVVQSGY